MTDRRTINLVVALIGAVAIIGLAGTIWLVTIDVDAANVAIVSGLAGTALGGLVGVLASTRSAPLSDPTTPIVDPTTPPPFTGVD